MRAISRWPNDVSVNKTRTSLLIAASAFGALAVLLVVSLAGNDLLTGL